MPKKTTAAKAPAVKMTAAEVVAAVRRRYGTDRDNIGPEWAALEEFSLAPGTGHQRIDLMLVRCWRGAPKGHERHAVEVKVSRADLLQELAKPGKSAPFQQVSHRFYLATPAGLVKDTDPIPANWGLYEIRTDRHGARTCRQVRAAARRDPDPMPATALVEAFRRAARAETRIATAGEDHGGEVDLSARVVDLERRLAAAQRALHTAKRSAARDRDALRAYLTDVALAGGWVCRCGKPLTKLPYRMVHSDESRWCENGDYPQPDLVSLAKRLGLSPSDEI